MEGKFITFEGGDGAGKSTHIALLASVLRQEGYNVVVSLEPGGTLLGEQIRQLLLHSGEVSPRAEALLYAADRAHHVDMRIRPALERGEIVLCDRYFDSSIAYQGAARTLGREEIRDLSLWATSNLIPDLTFLFDLPVEVGKKRRMGLGDRIERENMDFHEAVRAEYLELAAAEPQRWRVLDACEDILVVSAQVREHVNALLSA